MRLLFIHRISVVMLAIIELTACQENIETNDSKYVYIKPTYKDIELVQDLGHDSLHFILGEETYNEIKSFNYFNDSNSEYISFYDRRSESINIYGFKSQLLLNRIELKKCFKKKRLYKTSVYIKGLDSFFVIDSHSLYLLDSKGRVKKKMDFYNEVDKMAFFDNSMPLAIQNGIVYTGVRPYVNESSFADILHWRIIYRFDLNKQKKDLLYRLPTVYHTNLYDDRFFAYSLCQNDKGNLVFSFPADSNIYETNLIDYHVVYYGKSKFQDGPITAINKVSGKIEDGFKEYLLRDSYGPIYFDPYRKRYVRVVKHKISEDQYRKKSYQRKYSLIIFDENFRIVGEPLLKGDYSYYTLLFTKNGGIYAQVRMDDEYAFHFIKLAYKEEQDEHIILTKK